MMLDKNAVIDALEILIPESFYLPQHRSVFEAISELSKQNRTVDILTVTNALKTQGQLTEHPNAYFVSQLTTNVAATYQVQQYCRMIEEKRMLREFLNLNKLTEEWISETDDPFIVDERVAVEHSRIMGNITTTDLHTTKDLMPQVLLEIEKATAQNGMTGLPTGFREIDKLTGGLQKSDLIIVAARPGMGKTSMALSLAANVATKHEVLFFSIEMSPIQLAKRLTTMYTGISSDAMFRGSLRQDQFQEINNKVGGISKLKLTIDGNFQPTVRSIKTTALRHKNRVGLDLIVIDYLLLISPADPKGKSREQQVSEMSRDLKGLAKQLDVPILLLTQLSRANETRGGDKKPILSDLRDSGAIEQDADMVWFIHRPEYYGVMAYEDGSSTIGMGEILVAKNRHGALDEIKVKFDKHTTKFSDEEPYGFEPIKPNNRFEIQQQEDNTPF